MLLTISYSFSIIIVSFRVKRAKHLAGEWLKQLKSSKEEDLEKQYLVGILVLFEFKLS